MRESFPPPSQPPEGGVPEADGAPDAARPAFPRASLPGPGLRAPVPEGRRLKVLQVSHDLKAGGLQRVVVDLAAGLARLGHEAHICSLRGGGPLEKEILARGLTLWALPWPDRGADRLQFARLRRLMKLQRYDVAHTHNTHAFLDGGLAALLAGVPARIHTDHARPFPDKLRYMLLERAMACAYHKVVGVSAHTADNLHRYEGIPEARLAVIENGIDGAWYRAERDRLDRAALRLSAGLAGFSPVIGLGVRLEEQKGIVHLLNAMPALLERHERLALAVAGSGSLKSALEARARALGVAEHVRFLGPYPQLASFYPLLDAFVLPSLWEGLPLCLLEAMALSLPIVATAVGGVPGVLENGRSALLVEPGSPVALAAAVTRLLDDPIRAEAMGRQGRRVFEERYDSAAMVRGYLALYREALGEAAP